MDVSEVYDPVAHTLTFAEAARRGGICDYRVIISVVTSAMVNHHLLRHGEVIVKGDAVKKRVTSVRSKGEFIARVSLWPERWMM